MIGFQKRLCPLPIPVEGLEDLVGDTTTREQVIPLCFKRLETATRSNDFKRDIG